MATTSTSSPFRAASRLPPKHTIHERGSSRKLVIGDWVIESVKKPILSSKELDKVAETIDIPLPEITFGNNSLSLVYTPPSTSSPPNPDAKPEQIRIQFATLPALAGVANGEGWEEKIGGGVRVAMAAQWEKQRVSTPSYLSDLPIPSRPIKPYDWTYSSLYAGEVQSSTPGETAFQPTTAEQIPMDLLARQDPVLDQILFYDDVSLFEDELHDNGDSVMNVRIRVMPHSFFILHRLLLRVDNVLFRLHDVRVYHEFGTGKVLREVVGKEVGYGEVKARLESQEDLMPLTNPNWVVTQINTLAAKSPTGSTVPLLKDGEGRELKAWPGLGVRREVLWIGGQRGVEDLGKGLEGIKLGS